MDDSEADAYIDSGDNDCTVPWNVKDNALDAIISEEYNEEQILPCLPSIDAKLPVVVTKWLRTLPARDKVKELFKNCMLPSDVEGLQPMKINSIVYDKLNPSYKINDQWLRGINTFLAQGLGLIVSIWDTILSWETALNKNDNTDATLSHCMGIIQCDDLKLDLTEVRHQLDKSIQL